jgi:hypothetical protein
MRGPPDPDMRKGRVAAQPQSQNQFPYEAESTELVCAVQALKLRRLYSFCHATACTIASLAFAVSR